MVEWVWGSRVKLFSMPFWHPFSRTEIVYIVYIVHIKSYSLQVRKKEEREKGRRKKVGRGKERKTYNFLEWWKSKDILETSWMIHVSVTELFRKKPLKPTCACSCSCSVLLFLSLSFSLSFSFSLSLSLSLSLSVCHPSSTKFFLPTSMTVSTYHILVCVSSWFDVCLYWNIVEYDRHIAWGMEKGEKVLLLCPTLQARITSVNIHSPIETSHARSLTSKVHTTENTWEEKEIYDKYQGIESREEGILREWFCSTRLKKWETLGIDMKEMERERTS